MNQLREKEAVSAYLKLLQSKGATTHTLYKHSLFLDIFTRALEDKSANGNEYSKVLDLIMEEIPVDDWHDSLNVAREFYPFWVKDFRAIAAFSLHFGFDVESVSWKPLPTSLKSLTDSLVNEKFDISENWPLKAYSHVLRSKNAESCVEMTRIMLAKILLIRLREAPVKNHRTYRTAVDLTLPLFKMKENKHLFLVVVREFYHFWTGNPDAESIVLNDGSKNIMQ